MAHHDLSSQPDLRVPVVIDEHGIVQKAGPVTLHAVVDKSPGGFGQTVKDWQGLEAGGLAIVAAVIGAWALNRQTTQNRTIEINRLKRELRARRSVLPLTLSSLGEWADACGELLLDAYHKAHGTGLARTAVQKMAPLPGEIVIQLERFVEASDDTGAASIANLVGDVQIFVSRMRGAGFLPGIGRGKNQVPSDLESHLLGIGAIAAHIGALFDYSRRRSETTPAHPTWDEVRTSLKLIGADPAVDPKLFARLDGREKTGRHPGYLGEEAASSA